MSHTLRSRLSSLFTCISKHIAVAIGFVLAPATCVPTDTQIQIVPTITTFAGNGTPG
jgi:hypothetical protein